MNHVLTRLVAKILVRDHHIIVYCTLLQEVFETHLKFNKGYLQSPIKCVQLKTVCKQRLRCLNFLAAVHIPVRRMSCIPLCVAKTEHPLIVVTVLEWCRFGVDARIDQQWQLHRLLAGGALALVYVRLRSERVHVWLRTVLTRVVLPWGRIYSQG